MDITPIINTVTAMVATATFLVAALSAKRSWDEKRKDSERAQMERRQAELHRLTEAFENRAAIFNEVFDYESGLDAHLRVDRLHMDFTDEEVATRTQVDRAFEHLRDLHRSLQLGLIETEDLSFWTYWIHRVLLRAPLATYATACGYNSFLKPLQEATADDPHLRELQEFCPWWPGRKKVRISIASPSALSSPGDVADANADSEGQAPASKHLQE